MRVPSMLLLALGILLFALLTVRAPEVAAFLAVQSETVRLLLIGGAGALSLVWVLVLCLSMRVDQQDVAARIGGQRGREAGAKLRQKSVSLTDRQDSLEERISVADARRALRRWILVEIAPPYVVLLCISAISLFVTLKSIGGVP